MGDRLVLNNLDQFIAARRDYLRRGLALMLQAFDDLELVGEAANGMQAVELCAQIQSDVILMDLVMPELGGADKIRKLGVLVRTLIAFEGH